MKGNSGASAKSEFVITRVFNAPRELVWKALTEPQRLDQWWGPKGFLTRVVSMDLRVGGALHYSMKLPDGQDWWAKWVYREITPPEKLVFVLTFTDENGTSIRNPMSATWPVEMLNSIVLSAQDGKTLLRSTGVPINASDLEHQTFREGFESMTQGWTGTWDQLAEYLAKNKV